MKLIILVLVLLSSSFGVGAQSRPEPVSRDEKELVRIAQELFDAIAIGNKPVWEKYVAPDVIYTDENWRILTKKDLVDSLAPLPKGYSGSIRMANVQSRINGDAAVLSYRALEEETVFGQKLTPIYLVTDTYFKRNGQWQMVASHISVLPSERKSVLVNAKRLESIVGEYELSPGNTYTITIEGNKLMGQRSGRAKEELLAADEHTFFPRGSVRGEKVFVQDDSGRTLKMLDRRENNDLVWTKVK
ncbi:MAG TPA: DUF4440 domain-containing protein [Blastocatellia bacterium]|nr:DUF4440 domain-containing protein [Blastocatellia bacterium]